MPVRAHLSTTEFDGNPSLQTGEAGLQHAFVDSIIFRTSIIRGGVEVSFTLAVFHR